MVSRDTARSAIRSLIAMGAPIHPEVKRKLEKAAEVDEDFAEECRLIYDGVSRRHRQAAADLKWLSDLCYENRPADPERVKATEGRTHHATPELARKAGLVPFTRPPAR